MQGLLFGAAAAGPGSGSQRGSGQAAGGAPCPAEWDLPARDTKSHSLQSPAASCRASRSCQACTDSSGLQKSPLLGLFAAASFCILAQSRGLAGAQAVALTPPFCPQKYSQLTSSGPACVFHSPAVVLPSANTDAKPPSPPQTPPVFVSIFSLCIL